MCTDPTVMISGPDAANVENEYLKSLDMDGKRVEYIMIQTDIKVSLDNEFNIYNILNVEPDIDDVNYDNTKNKTVVTVIYNGHRIEFKDQNNSNDKKEYSGPSLVPCRVCNKLVQSCKMSRHVKRLHTITYKCELCQMIFPERRNLHRHCKSKKHKETLMEHGLM